MAGWQDLGSQALSEQCVFSLHLQSPKTCYPLAFIPLLWLFLEKELHADLLLGSVERFPLHILFSSSPSFSSSSSFANQSPLYDSEFFFWWEIAGSVAFYQIHTVIPHCDYMMSGFPELKFNILRNGGLYCNVAKHQKSGQCVAGRWVC